MRGMTPETADTFPVRRPGVGWRGRPVTGLRGRPGVTVATVVLSLVAWMAVSGHAHGGEHVEARAIDGACTRAAQGTSQETPHPAPRFPDIEGNVHEAAINCLAHWDITRGRDGGYVPRTAVRRDAMASFVSRMMRPTDDQFPERDEDDPPAFGDTDGNVHQANVNHLADAGVVQGRADGDYHPSEPVSRAAMASYIARALERVTGEALEDGDADPAFSDTRGSVHEDAINALASLGIVEGRDDGTYGPNEAVRRDAMASFVARSMDYLAEQGHWPVPTTVELEPAEDTNPANAFHRVEGTVLDQWATGSDDGPEHRVSAAAVRVEIYRDSGDGFDLVDTRRVVSDLGGDLFFGHNLDAVEGDRDVVIACPLHADDDPGEDDQWCADVDTDDGDATVAPDEDRGADAVTAAWAAPVAPEAAADDSYPGHVVAHHADDAALDLQTLDNDRSAGHSHERLLRLAYQEADEFHVDRAEGRAVVTVEQFQCALDAALDEEGGLPSLMANYATEGKSTFDLGTSADVAHCLSG